MTLRQTPLDDVGRAGSAMNSAADDRQLLERIAARDQTALRALYARHQARVFRFVLRLVKQEAIAEELTNEVFLEAWRNAGTFEGKASASTWLLSIAHHRAVSSQRKRPEQAWNEETAAEIADTDDDPEVVAQKADKSVQLRRAMDQLSPVHREIIDLVYYHEMSIAEVSEVVRIPENTVKTRMFYARRRLRRQMEGDVADWL